jgi:hypothetical protein
MTGSRKKACSILPTLFLACFLLLAIYRLPNIDRSPYFRHWSPVDSILMNHLAFQADGSQGTEVNSVAEHRFFSLLVAPLSPLSKQRAWSLMATNRLCCRTVLAMICCGRPVETGAVDL